MTRLALARFLTGLLLLVLLAGCASDPPATTDDDGGNRGDANPTGDEPVANAHAQPDVDDAPVPPDADESLLAARATALAATARSALQQRNTSGPFRTALACTGRWEHGEARLHAAARVAAAIAKELPDVVHPAVSLAWFDRAEGVLGRAADGDSHDACALARQLGADLLVVVVGRRTDGPTGSLLSAFLTADGTMLGDELPTDLSIEPRPAVVDTDALPRLAAAMAVQMDVALIVRTSFADPPRPLAPNAQLIPGSYLRVWLRTTGAATAAVWLVTADASWPLFPTDDADQPLLDATVRVAPQQAWLQLQEPGEFAIVAHAVAARLPVLDAALRETWSARFPAGHLDRLGLPLLAGNARATNVTAWAADRQRRLRDAVMHANVVGELTGTPPWPVADTDGRMLTIAPGARLEWMPGAPHVQLVDGTSTTTRVGRFPAPDALELWFGRDRLLLPEPLGDRRNDADDPDDGTDRTPAARQLVTFSSTAGPGAVTFVRRFRVVAPPPDAETE